MKTRWHILALVLVAFGVGAIFLREPGFGDDLTYWNFAFDLHERGLRAWQRHSFHDLRWPVWGVCWVLQSVLDFGLGSYWGEPLLYLGAGAALSFAFGKMVSRSNGVAWASGIAFLFHPLLDTVCYRPMPDLSEGVWGAATMLAWWQLMNAERRAWLWALLVGAGVFVIEANRITGVFIVPVLALCTLLFFRRRFGWLCLAGAVAAALWVGEAAFYHRLFGDWLHDIHANLGNKGAKGIETLALWAVPFRFVDSLWKGSPLAPVYCLGALAGIGFAWRLPRHEDTSRATLGRVVAVWFVALYLAYACTPQGFKGGWNPLIRDADRFLCGLVVPMSVLAALGLAWLVALARRVPAIDAALSRPAVVGAVAVAALPFASSRDFFDLGFAKKMRAYMRALPAGTKVFTHHAMRGIAFLVDPADARRIEWHSHDSILHRNDALEADAAAAQQFWYARKLVWLTTRKKLEKKSFEKPPQLASYFDTPERDWRMTALLAKGDTPDLIFYRRRTANDVPARELNATAAEFNGLVPALPAEWRKPMPVHPTPVDWKVPSELRGQFVRAEIVAGSEQVEALSIRLRFFHGAALDSELLLKPYLHPQPGKEFFAFQIPATSDRCEAQLRFSKAAKAVQFTNFRAILEAPPSSSAD